MTKEGNLEVRFEWCQYGSGPANGLFAVRKITKKDYAYFLTQHEAEAFIRQEEELQKAGVNGHSHD